MLGRDSSDLAQAELYLGTFESWEPEKFQLLIVVEILFRYSYFEIAISRKYTEFIEDSSRYLYMVSDELGQVKCS